MSAPPRWPSDEELSQLLAGNLHQARQAEIEAQLEQDEALRERLDKLAGGSSWIGRAGGSSASAPNAVCDDDFALLAAMDGLKHQASAATVVQGVERGAMVLSFLTPSESPGSLGKLGHYEVLELIGTGGFGLVLKAQDSKLNRLVAIKVLAPHLASHATARRRFTREAHTAAAINHPHVVTIHAIEENQQTPFLVMEYVAGQSLQELIDRQGPLDVPQILRIGAQAAAGLAAAHKHGQIHRDIKPANILLENGVQRVKITDFGLARAADDASLTQSGVIAGTPQYMAPEQARGEAVDYRADLFSLGSVLYTMCTGRPAFRADSAVAVLKRVCDDQPRPIRAVNPEIPDWLAGIIDRLMSKRREERFQSAQEVGELLEKCLAHVQQPELAPLPLVAMQHAQQLRPRSASVASNAVPPIIADDTALEIDAAKYRARGPALGLIALGVLNLLMLMLLMLAGTTLLVSKGSPDDMHTSVPTYAGMFGWAIVSLGGLSSLLQIVAGVQLQRLRMWPLVMCAAIVSILTLSVCGIGLIVGIATLWVLLDPKFQRACRLAAGESLPPLPQAPVKPQALADLAKARELVRWPATALMLVAILNVLAMLLLLVMMVRMDGQRASVMISLLLVVTTVFSIITAAGSRSMATLHSWPLAVTGAIFAMLIGPGSVIGLAIGIWALVVLMRKDVRDAFERSALEGGQVAPSRQGGYSLVAVIISVILLGGGMLVILPCAGWFLHSSGSVPNRATISGADLRLDYDTPNITIEVQGVRDNFHIIDRWMSGDENNVPAQMTRGYPPGDYYVRAYDAENIKLFEQYVSLQDGSPVTVKILPQYPAMQRIAAWPNQGYLDRNDVRGVALSPTGQHAAWGLKSNVIVLCELEQGREVLRFTVTDPSVFAFSPDGKFIAALGTEKDNAPPSELAVCLYNTTNQEAKFLKLTGKQTEGKYSQLQNVKAIAFSPDGATVLVSSAYGVSKQFETDTEFKSLVHRWNVASGEELPPLTIQDGLIDHIAFPSGLSNIVATTSQAASERGAILALWDLDGMKAIGRVHWSESTFDSLALTPQAGWIYAAYYDPIAQPGRVKGPYVNIYATRNHSAQRGLFLEPGKINLKSRAPAMTMSRDGKVFALCQDLEHVELYEVNSLRPKLLAVLGGGNFFAKPILRFTDDNKQLLATGVEPRVLKWDVARFTTAGESGATVLSAPNRNFAAPMQLVPTKLPAEQPEDEPRPGIDGVLPISLERKITSPYDKPIARLLPLADGESFITAGQGDEGRHVLRWNRKANDFQHRFAEVPQDAIVTSAAVSNDGTRLATGTKDGQVMVWNLKTNQLESNFKAHADSIAPSGLRFHWNGRDLLSGGRDTMFDWWKDATGAKLYEDKSGAPIEFVDVVPGNDWYLYGGAAGKFKLRWMVGESAFTKEFETGEGNVTTIAFHGDQKHFITGDDRGNISYWYYDFNLKPMQKFRGHQGAIGSLAMLPDDKHFVSGSTDGTIRVWSLITGKEVARAKAETPYTSAVAVLEGGRTLVSALGREIATPQPGVAPADHTLVFWRMPTLPTSPNTTVHDEQINQLRKEYEQAQSRYGLGLVTEQELNEIEIKRIDARIARAQAVGNRDLTRYYLEDLVRVRRKVLERCQQLKTAGTISQVEVDRAEAAVKIAEAQLKASDETPQR